VGHALAGITPALLRTPEGPPRARLAWLAGLVLCAWAPDVDYLIAAPGTASDPRARLTHALASALVVPAALTATALRRRALEAALAGLSHPTLDLLVGVTALPLGWPLWDGLLHLPFGVLPSAGRMHPGNVYFWRNLGLELGVLGPLVAAAVAWRRGRLVAPRARAVAALGVLLSVTCMALASNLQR
jgi:hypothetical protein